MPFHSSLPRVLCLNIKREMFFYFSIIIFIIFITKSLKYGEGIDCYDTYSEPQNKQHG